MGRIHERGTRAIWAMASTKIFFTVGGGHREKTVDLFGTKRLIQVLAYGIVPGEKKDLHDHSGLGRRLLVAPHC